MSKDFSTGLNLLVGGAAADKPKAGRPKTSAREITKSSQEGTKENETRATFIVNEAQLEKIKAIAYWDRDAIKEVVNVAFGEFLERYEKKNGTIKPLPAGK